MEPDLELVQVRDDQSFKIWSHGYPFRTVRWHFHPEYELHLVTATEGNRYVGDHIGPFSVDDLVFVGPNLPHNWISNVPDGEFIAERCVVLQFTGEFINTCLVAFPELRFIQPLLKETFRGVRFEAAAAKRVAPLMRDLLDASDARRLALFMEIIDVRGPRRKPHAARQHRLQTGPVRLSVERHKLGAAAHRAQLHPRPQRGPSSPS